MRFFPFSSDHAVVGIGLGGPFLPLPGTLEFAKSGRTGLKIRGTTKIVFGRMEVFGFVLGSRKWRSPF
jgi:hypothetical protein